MDGGSGQDYIIANMDSSQFSVFNRNIAYEPRLNPPYPGIGYKNFENVRINAFANLSAPFLRSIWASSSVRYEINLEVFLRSSDTPKVPNASYFKINGNPDDGRVFVADETASQADRDRGATSGVWSFPGTDRMPIVFNRTDPVVPDFGDD